MQYQDTSNQAAVVPTMSLSVPKGHHHANVSSANDKIVTATTPTTTPPPPTTTTARRDDATVRPDEDDDLDLMLRHEDFPTLLQLAAKVKAAYQQLHASSNAAATIIARPSPHHHRPHTSLRPDEVLGAVARLQDRWCGRRQRQQQLQQATPTVVARDVHPVVDSIMDDALATLQQELEQCQQALLIHKGPGGSGSAAAAAIVSAVSSSDMKNAKNVTTQKDAGGGTSNNNKRKKEAIAVKYSKWQTDILMNWMIAHKSQPFPGPDQIESLMQRTGLTQTQVVNWTTNVRKRNRKATCQKGKKPHHFIDFLFLAHDREVRRSQGMDDEDDDYDAMEYSDDHHGNNHHGSGGHHDAAAAAAAIDHEADCAAPASMPASFLPTAALAASAVVAVTPPCRKPTPRRSSVASRRASLPRAAAAAAPTFGATAGAAAPVLPWDDAPWNITMSSSDWPELKVNLDNASFDLFGDDEAVSMMAGAATTMMVMEPLAADAHVDGELMHEFAKTWLGHPADESKLAYASPAVLSASTMSDEGMLLPSVTIDDSFDGGGNLDRYESSLRHHKRRRLDSFDQVIAGWDNLIFEDDDVHVWDLGLTVEVE